MSRFHELRRHYTIEDALLIGLVLLLGATALALGANQTLVLIVSSILILCFVLLMVSYTMMVSTAVKNRDVILSRDLWVHWEYDRETWSTFIRNQAIQAEMAAQASAWMPVLRKNAIALGLVTLLCFGFVFQSYGWAGMVSAGVLGFVFFGVGYRSAIRTQRILAAPYPLTAADDPTDVYIGAAGVAYPWNHVVFAQPKLSVTGARVTPGNPTILRIATQYDLGKGNAITYDIIVPIPPGKEPAADNVADKVAANLVDAPHQLPTGSKQ